MAAEISNIEWRAYIKFLTKLDRKPMEILKALNEVYKEKAPKKSVVYLWVKRFKVGRETLVDNIRSGRPSTSINEKTIAAVRSIVEEKGIISSRIIANELGISRGSAHFILAHKLQLSKLSAHWVPKALNQEQDESLQRLKEGSEIEMDQNYPKSKIQSLQIFHGENEPKAIKMHRLTQKIEKTKPSPKSTIGRVIEEAKSPREATKGLGRRRGRPPKKNGTKTLPEEGI